MTRQTGATRRPSFAGASGTREDAARERLGNPNPTFAGAPLPRVGWIANAAALLARIGADPQDDEELRQKKALLVLLAVLILPVSVVWGSAVPRLRLAGRRRSVHLLRGLARLVGGLRANPTLPAAPGHATPRHPADDDGRADAVGRVPSFRRGRAVGHPGSARSTRLPRGASGCPLVRCVRRASSCSLGVVGRAVLPGRGLPGVVHDHDAGAEHRSVPAAWPSRSSRRSLTSATRR